MFSKTDSQKLAPFFTNLDKPVFVLLNMPEVLKGALFSRYSRSARPLRELFLEEYLRGADSGFDASSIDWDNFTDIQKVLVTEKAEKFYTRWLAEYGDDSIAELGGIHVGVENISVLATKSLEDRRLGLSFLEKSTRYVRFDDKVDGHYRYFVDADLAKSKYSKLYTQTMDFLFDTYAEMVEPMMSFFRNKYPKPAEVSDKAYETSIRAKACDTLRGLLPFATLTNMGVFGNGRAYEYMLTRMFASDLAETLGLAGSIFEELHKVIPNFVERIKTEKGELYVDYLKKTAKSMNAIAKKYHLAGKQFEKSGVRLLDYDERAEEKTVAGILFASSNLPYKKLLQEAKKMGKKARVEILRKYAEHRLGRWHKIGRAFEESYYTFEIVSDAGAYKDLQRHRVMTSERQLFSCNLGYDVPADIVEAGLAKKYSKAMDLAGKTYAKIVSKFPVQAQYVVTHGYKVRYRMKLNLREAFHLCELRSSPQGHPNYRFIAQEMYKRIKEVHPIFGETMRYVNMSDPGLERLSAEIRREDKLKKA